MNEDATLQEQQGRPPRWQPLSAVDRRVAGVLIEKAKTTPNAYPLSLNAVTTGCNQKSNRSPLMNLDPDDVQESLDRLRELGAVGVVEGYGRVSKYRHYLYEWLGVDKVEMAVMAELLLRGPQTVGELRARAARMEPIRDLAQMQPVLASLKSKGLVIPLTRPGRGHVVAHALYQAGELDQIKAEYGTAAPTADSPSLGETVSDRAVSRAPAPATPGDALPQAAPAPVPPSLNAQVAEALCRQIEELRSQVAQLRSDVDDLAIALTQTTQDLSRLRDELGS